MVVEAIQADLDTVIVPKALKTVCYQHIIADEDAQVEVVGIPHAVDESGEVALASDLAGNFGSVICGELNGLEAGPLVHESVNDYRGNGDVAGEIPWWPYGLVRFK